MTRSLAETCDTTGKAGVRAGRACYSRFMGVSRSGYHENWVAQIRRNGVGKALGRFQTEEQAALAYDAAARVIFGEHVYLNFPDRPPTLQAMAAMDIAVNQAGAHRLRKRELERRLRRPPRNGGGSSGPRGRGLVRNVDDVDEDGAAAVRRDPAGLEAVAPARGGCRGAS